MILLAITLNIVALVGIALSLVIFAIPTISVDGWLMTVVIASVCAAKILSISIINYAKFIPKSKQHRTKD